MTENEMKKMQQEAIRRAQEMHRRASHISTTPEEAKRTPEHEPLHDPSDRGTKEPPETEAHIVGHSADSALPGGIFETLFRDKEKTLILGILLLLMDEKTDNGLILALMYLLI